MPAERTATRKRSLVKALTYRVVIVCLDFLVIYIFTHKVEVALGFMIISNIYTTVAYFLHERIWARIQWGKEPCWVPRHLGVSRSQVRHLGDHGGFPAGAGSPGGGAHR
jgi:uncharacterized membrane protein